MPRPLVYSNGSFFLGVDRRGRIRDLYWPQLGRWNHLSGYAIRFGLWTENDFSWLDDERWKRDQSVESGTLIGHETIKRAEADLTVEIRSAIDPEEPVFVQQWHFTNLAASARLLKLFVTEDMRLMESDIGDTALYHPQSDAMIHFKGPIAIALAGESERGGIREYACGIKAFDGNEGTWRDAEDGHLSGNPIAQGSVDCTFSLEIELPPHGTAQASLFIAAGGTIYEASERICAVRKAGAKRVTDRHTERDLEVEKSVLCKLPDLPADLAILAARCMNFLLAHCDSQGAILAALDSDIMETNRATYAYCWPRDGALIGQTLLRYGFRIEVRRFLEFCLRVLPKDRPAFLQKYTSDGCLGATWHPWTTSEGAEIPIQEDETALVVSLACAFLDECEDAGLRTQLADHLIRPCAQFLLDFRDEGNGLPLPSYDLWEERRAVHLATIGTVVEALEAAATVCSDLGERCLSAAAQMRAAVRQVGFIEDGEPLARSALYRHGSWQFDRTPDASLIPHLRSLAPDVTDVTKEPFLSALGVNPPVGGLARYPGDYYFRRSEQQPGNPWILTTLWLTNANIETAASLDELDETLRDIHWVERLAEPTGALAEQYHAETGAPLSVSPLAWSHASYLETALQWQVKRDEIASRAR